jgi:hypothetical protein
MDANSGELPGTPFSPRLCADFAMSVPGSPKGLLS